jgi:hypothetical protein
MLVIVGVMQIIVPIIAALALDMISILVEVLDLATCILGLKNVPKVFIALTLAVLQPGG